MFLWWLPLGCLFLAAACVLTLAWLDGVALQAGVGVAAVFFYAALMCVHFFERAPPTGRRREDAGAAAAAIGDVEEAHPYLGHPGR